MSKKEEKKNAENLAALSQVNPFDHGYKPGTGVTISGELFMAFMDFTGAIAQSERKEFVELVAVPMGAQPEADNGEPKTVRVLTTPTGFKADQLFNEVVAMHYENINKGITVSEASSKLVFNDTK